jgi:2,3-bisphosphoglycerate-dependent phosphoglycerate mutase
MTTIYLVRHAHAHWQPSEQRPLSDRGKASAEALAERFGRSSIDAIYSSPARRALETVQPLACRLQLSPVVVADLRERELTAPTAASFAAAIETSWRVPDRAVDPSGESNAAGQARGTAVVREMLTRHRDGHVMLATHGSLLALIVNAFDRSFGYEFWRGLTFPDVYELTFQDDRLAGVRRAWEQPT